MKANGMQGTNGETAVRCDTGNWYFPHKSRQSMPPPASDKCSTSYTQYTVWTRGTNAVYEQDNKPLPPKNSYNGGYLSSWGKLLLWRSINLSIKPRKNKFNMHHWIRPLQTLSAYFVTDYKETKLQLASMHNLFLLGPKQGGCQQT